MNDIVQTFEAVGGPLAIAVVALLGVLAWRQWSEGERRAGDRRGGGRDRSGRHLLAWIAGGLVLAVATAVGLATLIGQDAIGQVLTGLDRRVVVVAVVVEVAALACLTQVYRAAYRLLGGDLGYRDALTVSLGSFTLAELLPGGGAVGGLFAARRLTRHSGDAVIGTTTVLVFGLVTIGTLGLLVGAGATALAVGSPTHASVALVGLGVTIAVVAALVGVAAAARSARVRARLVGLLARVTRRGPTVAAGWMTSVEHHGQLLRRPGGLLPSAAWSAVNWTLDVAVLALLVHAAGGDAPLLGVLLAFGVANLLNGLPLTPGGVGVVEAGITGTLVTFGVDPASAAVAAVAYRLVGHWLPMLLASPLIARGLGRRGLAESSP